MDVLSELGATPFRMVGAALMSALGWFVLSLLLVLTLYFLARARGWLDTIKGQKSKGSRIGFLLLLLFIVGPAATAFGTIRGVREVVIEEVGVKSAQIGATQAIGKLLLAPLVVITDIEAHIVDGDAATAMDRLSVAQIHQMLSDRSSASDVSFLLEEDGDVVTSALKGGLIETLVTHLEPDASAIERFLLSSALKSRFGSISDRLGLYKDLLAEMEADPGGRLTWQSAATQVGNSVIEKYLNPPIRSFFTPYLLLFGLIAVLPPPLWLGGVFLISRRKQKKLPAPENPEANDSVAR